MNIWNLQIYLPEESNRNACRYLRKDLDVTSLVLANILTKILITEKDHIPNVYSERVVV